MYNVRDFSLNSFVVYDGKVKYSGTAEFQNVFGAWIQKLFLCHYDPVIQAIIDFEI